MPVSHDYVDEDFVLGGLEARNVRVYALETRLREWDESVQKEVTVSIGVG